MPTVPDRSGPVLGLALSVSMALLSGCGSDGPSSPVPASRLVVGEFLFRGGQDTLEWIELRNDGDASAPLAGVSIPAVAYRFPAGTPALPPGRRLLLVNSAPLFAARHPGVPIFGVFPGRLADEGEVLSLEATGGDGFSVRWDRSLPWPQGAVRAGRSMVWNGGDPRLPASWAASAVEGGQPGSGETPVVDPDVGLSEVLPASPSGPAFVELASKASASRDIGGWWIVLDGDAPDTLVVPTGTVIPAGGRVVFSRSPSDPSLGLGSLDPRPEEGRILLVERAPDGRPSGFVDMLEWEALPPGSSIARFDAWSSGVPAAPSPGTGDEGAGSPAAYISEICYHPASGAEYVELASLADAPIALGRATTPDSAWSLEGTGLRFGPGDTLPARGRLLVVSSQEVSPEVFRTLHGIPATVPVLAASGRLDNAGEHLVLGFPAAATTDAEGALQWKIRTIDEARWMPISPWPPAADGGGACLERVDPRIPGASPSAWRAAAPSPGT